jgi:hypothetical protein
VNVPPTFARLHVVSKLPAFFLPRLGPPNWLGLWARAKAMSCWPSMSFSSEVYVPYRQKILISAFPV